MAAAIPCGKCRTSIPSSYFNLDHLTACPTCGSDMQVMVFPAMFQVASSTGPAAAGSSDATCFYHAENVAVASCVSCGRYLCSVCEVEFGNEVLCPGCIHAGVTTRKLARLENRRTLYDSVALAVATAPSLLIWPSVITAPMAIFLAIRYWKAPSSIVSRTKIRFVLAIVLALAQITVWGFFAYSVALAMNGSAR
jgi:hypothetical protein